MQVKMGIGDWAQSPIPKSQIPIYMNFLLIINNINNIHYYIHEHTNIYLFIENEQSMHKNSQNKHR